MEPTGNQNHVLAERGAADSRVHERRLAAVSLLELLDQDLRPELLQLFDPSPLPQKLKPSYWSQFCCELTQAVNNCALADSTKENLAALPPCPSTTSTVPARAFSFSFVVTSPGVCRPLAMSKRTGCEVWPKGEF